MNDERRLSWTRWIVLAGILLSYLSYGTAKRGWGELFPFAHWRLYSAPVGINEEATTFRLYVLDDGSQTWSRVPEVLVRSHVVDYSSALVEYPLVEYRGAV